MKTCLMNQIAAARQALDELEGRLNQLQTADDLNAFKAGSALSKFTLEIEMLLGAQPTSWGTYKPKN